MFGGIRITRPAGDEAEKPFWISYADLMTALMVLFLVVMVASLLSLTQTVSNLESTRKKYDEFQRQTQAQAEIKREQAERVERFWDDLERASKDLGVHVNRNARLVNFGARGRFASGSDRLSSSDQALVRRFADRLLKEANTTNGRRVVRQIVVEGYADRRGSYLFNLNLSSNRGQRVLCTLLQSGGAYALSAAEKTQVRNLFRVDGFSFNATKRSLAESRRVEVRIDEIRDPNQRRPPSPGGKTSFGACSLGA